MPAAPACGPHADLVQSKLASVTRCPCGRIHVVIHTRPHQNRLVFEPESFRHFANVCSAALRLLDYLESKPTVPPPPIQLEDRPGAKPN